MIEPHTPTKDPLTEEMLRALFTVADITIVRTHEMLNQYWRANDVMGAWWLVETLYGSIRIGWRKRVIEIDWSGTPLRQIVTEDQTTKEPMLVHAWGYLKAIEYLATLRRLLVRSQSTSIAVTEPK